MVCAAITEEVETAYLTVSHHPFQPGLPFVKCTGKVQRLGLLVKKFVSPVKVDFRHVKSTTCEFLRKP